MLFLVSGTVVRVQYMIAKKMKTIEIRLVEAESPKTAQIKFENHYSEQSDENGDSIQVIDVQVTETIT